MLDRTDSALAHRDQASAFSQKLGSISQRAEPVNNIRSLAEEAGTLQNRPSLRESQNCSKSRPDEHYSSIPIAASPSIYIDKRNRRSLPALPDAHKLQARQSMPSVNHRTTTVPIAEIDISNVRNDWSLTRDSMTEDQARPHTASLSSPAQQPGPKFPLPTLSPHAHFNPLDQNPDEVARLGHRVLSDLCSGGSSPAASSTESPVAEPKSKPGENPSYSIIESEKTSETRPLAKTV
ncbi:hypothetical protein CDEST_09238 [Colletotrichum destructivum]|uniref:Uncharacterized protein n=1 Tax=Colletotrichum destructivum TaxID=34406 RepID=A0AAX4ILL1_9PEZI|nr:hypothetical protein CDEST_09238 [Colletotrichum destructivum]